MSEKNKSIELTIEDIKKLIPHRYPFLLVDKIIDIVPFESATGIKNVTINEITNPKVIIQPKSIIGFIPLKTKDRNAHIVVRTVYKIGSIIFLLA